MTSDYSNIKVFLGDVDITHLFIKKDYVFNYKADHECAHGKPLYGDECDTCWDIEMSEYHCRRCDESSYYSSDFKHLPDCPISHIDIPHTPSNYWRKLPPGHARKV